MGAAWGGVRAVLLTLLLLLPNLLQVAAQTSFSSTRPPAPDTVTRTSSTSMVAFKANDSDTRDGSGNGSSNGDSGGRGGSGQGIGGAANCTTGLWEAAKAAPDLRILVTVQRLTTFNFFTPFGKKSKRKFTLLAPTDRAFFASFNGTSGDKLQALQSGFPAILLYHQYLEKGLSARQLAERYSVVTALGSLANEPRLKVAVDRQGSKYVASGLAPNNHAVVVRETEACGSRLLVLDQMLRPMANLSQLPRLQSMNPIQPRHWEDILAVMLDSALGLSSTNGSSPSSVSDTSKDYGGSGGSSAGVDSEEAPRPRSEPPDLLPAEAPGPAMGAAASAGGPALALALPPPPLGTPPDCTGLAASGQLINATGNLASGCGLMEGADSVISSGTTQTAVSDAGQIDPAALAPAPTSAAPPAMHARAARLLGFSVVLALASLVALVH